MDPIEERCPRCHGYVWHRRDPCNCQTPDREFLGNDFLVAFGGRLRSIRESACLSLDALASRTGLSKAGLWALEKGQSEPMARTIVSLSFALNVSTDYLLLRG